MMSTFNLNNRPSGTRNLEREYMESYSIDCTGDVVVGDEITFERATFTGSWRRPKFAGNETITGKIIRDSYGAAKQQHTFTLELADGSTMTIKGRNIYRNGVKRKPWADESARHDATAEKHQRGDAARRQREVRKSVESMDFYSPTFGQEVGAP